MIADKNIIQQKILDIKHGRVKEGLKMDIPEIDEHLRLKLDGTLNLAIGHANVGKTSLLIYLFTLCAKKHDLRFVIFSSENTAQSVARKIVEFRLGKTIQESSDAVISKAMDWCYNHFKIIDAEKIYTYKTLLDEVQAIKDVWDFHGILIDPYNSLSKDYALYKSYGGYEYNYYCLTELRMFAKKYNIAVWVNCHGVTDALRKSWGANHEYAGLPRALQLADVEGGGAFGDRADDVICIHRQTTHSQDWMFTQMYVLKIKEIETGGRPTSHDEPIKLRMKINNVGYEFLGQDLFFNKSIKALQL